MHFKRKINPDAYSTKEIQHNPGFLVISGLRSMDVLGLHTRCIITEGANPPISYLYLNIILTQV